MNVKNIIVTEKPSVAMEFIKALGLSGDRQDGYFESDDWIVTWCVGHLIGMSYPEKYDKAFENWDIDMLPFLPETYLYEPIENVKKQFYTIQKLYNRKDIATIYYAGDPAREGIYIQMLVRQEAGHNPDAKELVVWIDSQTKEEILRGIREAKPLENYKLLADSGYMRAIEDYAFGINFTRLLTIRYGAMLNAAAGNGRKGPLAVGRVMTCVLGMVVKREREILNFKPTPYFKVKADMKGSKGDVALMWKVNPRSTRCDTPELYNDTGFKTKAMAERFISELPDALTVAAVNASVEKKAAPLLYNLAELQADCSKKLKLSPNETLAVAQSLYEKKLTTYPRTEAKVLSTAISKVIGDNLKGLADINEYHDTARSILNEEKYTGIADTKYTDDKKIEDHYALIPTGNTDALDSLNNTEKAVYDMIVKRFLSIFMPAAGYKKVKVTAVTETEIFTTTVTDLVDPGYLKLYGREPGGDDEEDKDKTGNTMEAVLALEKGNMYPTTYVTVDKETQPPKRYTSGSMVLAMENAGNLIEDEELREQIKTNGIGTSATRAATIEKLVNGEYIALNKKTQVLTPTAYGNMVYEVVNLTMADLLSPEMTANWEKGLDDIVKGKITQAAYRKKLEDYIRNKCLEMKANDQTKEVIERIRPYAKDKDFEENLGKPAKERYTGTYKPTGEEISFSREWGGHRFTDEEIVKMLDGGIIRIVAISRKDGSEHEVSGALSLQEYKGKKFWGFKMDDSCPPDKTEGLYKGKKKVRFKKTWGGHEFTDDEIQSLLNGDEIEFAATTKDGSVRNVKGTLQEQTYQGHKYWGFKMADNIPEGHAGGLYKGKKFVHFKRKWGGHEFTDDEVASLLKGDTITIDAVKKDGSVYKVEGELKEQTYEGHKYWGFKGNFGK